MKTNHIIILSCNVNVTSTHSVYIFVNHSISSLQLITTAHQGELLSLLLFYTLIIRKKAHNGGLTKISKEIIF